MRRVRKLVELCIAGLLLKLLHLQSLNLVSICRVLSRRPRCLRLERSCASCASGRPDASIFEPSIPRPGPHLQGVKPQGAGARGSKEHIKLYISTQGVLTHKPYNRSCLQGVKLQALVPVQSNDKVVQASYAFLMSWTDFQTLPLVSVCRV